MLRVLKLEEAPITNLPNEVSLLFNLHYLGLKRAKVKQLPSNIQKLQSLQTLDVRDCDNIRKQLPHGVTQLKQIRHLFFNSNEVGSKGAWQWKNLQTLKFIKANKKLLQQLGDMKELRSLSIMEVQQAHCPLLCYSLREMRNLHSLQLFAEDGELLNFEKLNSSPRLLQELMLRGRLFEGKMPTFVCSCAQLARVDLHQTHLVEDPLLSLCQLPKLVELTMLGNVFDGQKLHFRRGWFLKLKMLYLWNLENLNNIVIEEGAMIRLQELFLYDLKELKMVPHGIEFLTDLQSLTLVDMPNELVAKLRKGGNEQDRQKIRHVPKVGHFNSMNYQIESFF